MSDTNEPPVPAVSDDDVTRIVRREFPAALHATVMEVLHRYGGEPWHGDAPRVRLAILKLAGGNLERLQSQAAVACLDYRDVITPAEYPAYSQHNPGEPVAPEHAARLQAEDLAQYAAWLHGDAAEPAR